MDKLLRRNENTLVIVGTGVILYGLWSVVKTLFLALQELHRQSMDSSVLAMMQPFSPEIAKTVFFLLGVLLLVILLAADILLRLYVGLSARAEGFGRKKKGYGYLVIAALMAVASVTTLVAAVISIPSSLDTIEDKIVTIIVELTSCITMTEMIISALKVKKLRKESEAAQH